MLVPLLACVDEDLLSEDSPAPDTDTGDAGDTDDTDDTDDGGVAEPAPLAPLSDGECPDLSESGTSSFSSNGEEREVRVILPEGGGEGRPVLFVWYPLGGTARQMVQWLDLVDWASENDTVVVVPTSLSSNAFEWDFWTANSTHDVTMYDDLRTCLSQELGVDLTRIGSTGMSAGALWTTWLGMYRADTLSTIMTMSGGIPDVIENLAYSTPAWKYPALLFYGGEDDTYNAGGIVVDFEQGTLDFAAELTADGHLVITCDHGRGHDFPPEAYDDLTLWFGAHQYGQPSPYAQGDLSGLPDYCGVFAP